MHEDDLVRNRAARILIVDDDIVLVRGLKGALEHRGFVVRALESPPQAVHVAGEFQPDLVLLDVMMPGTDGWEVLARFRESIKTRSLPVIMLTAKDTESAKVKGFVTGADDYVTKPFSVDELRCRIDAVLRRSQPPSEPDDASSFVPFVGGTGGHELMRAADAYFAEGIHNYTYIHTYDARHLSRLSLRSLEDMQLDGFMRVHRSFIVNLSHVIGCRWVTHSSYVLRLSDLARTEIRVSRSQVNEVQRRFGVRR